MELNGASVIFCHLRVLPAKFKHANTINPVDFFLLWILTVYFKAKVTKVWRQCIWSYCWSFWTLRKIVLKPSIPRGVDTCETVVICYNTLHTVSRLKILQHLFVNTMYLVWHIFLHLGYFFKTNGSTDILTYLYLCCDLNIYVKRHRC